MDDWYRNDNGCECYTMYHHHHHHLSIIVFQFDIGVNISNQTKMEMITFSLNKFIQLILAYNISPYGLPYQTWKYEQST